MTSASKTNFGDDENVDFPIMNCPIELWKHRLYPATAFFYNIAASTLHFYTPSCGLTHIVLWFGMCACYLNLNLTYLN